MNQYANDFTRITQTYYNELKKYKPLTRAKEKRLLKKCKKGNLKAKNEILEANLRFVFEIAKRYTGRGVPISDLISDGNIGLLKAIEKFDESKDVKFISYAVWWIRQAMLESIKKRNAVSFVEIEPNEPNDTYIEKTSFLDEEDDRISKGDVEFSNELEEHKKEIVQAQRETISNLLNVLNSKERFIIENYYGINGNKELTLTEIGRKYNLSSERVRQIKNTSLKKLRTKALLLDDFGNLFC